MNKKKDNFLYIMNIIATIAIIWGILQALQKGEAIHNLADGYWGKSEEERQEDYDRTYK